MWGAVELPVTMPTAEGLSVEGASPALLAELLGQYGDLLQSTNPDIWLASRPGLPESVIEETLVHAGVAPHPELVTWWAWRDGWSDKAGRGAIIPQMSLAMACELLPEIEDLPAPMLRPEGTWIPVSGWEMRRVIAFSATSAADSPKVRMISPEFEPPHGQVTHAQVVSLCTYVAWHLDGIETGRVFFDPNTMAWKSDVEAWRAAPLEMRLTGLI